MQKEKQNRIRLSGHIGAQQPIGQLCDSFPLGLQPTIHGPIVIKRNDLLQQIFSTKENLQVRLSLLFYQLFLLPFFRSKTYSTSGKLFYTFLYLFLGFLPLFRTFFLHDVLFPQGNRTSLIQDSLKTPLYRGFLRIYRQVTRIYTGRCYRHKKSVKIFFQF